MRRYTRHLALAQIGDRGQQQLAASSVLVIGAGGLGSASIGYLAAMGIGRVGVVDDDRVELSNLQRQVLYETSDIGRLKVEAAYDRVEEVNPDCCLEPIAEKLTVANAATIMANYDLVLDGCDNFETRFAVNDACMAMGKTLIWAAISGFSGQIGMVKPGFACYRCLVPQLPELAKNCRQEGVIGALCGVMGSTQALEAVKELLNIGASLAGRVLRYDGLQATWQQTALVADAECPSCLTRFYPPVFPT